MFSSWILSHYNEFSVRGKGREEAKVTGGGGGVFSGVLNALQEFDWIRVEGGGRCWKRMGKGRVVYGGVW